MSNLTKPQSMDEVHEFAERVVQTIWELERALSEVRALLDGGEIDEIDADEPVPFELVDHKLQAEIEEWRQADIEWRQIVAELLGVPASEVTSPDQARLLIFRRQAFNGSVQ